MTHHVPDEREVPLLDIPSDVLASIVRSIANYAVLIYAVEPGSKDDPNIRQLGSGTLIECDGKKGVLTAHHVVHETEVDWSTFNKDEILLSIDEKGRAFRMPAPYFREHVVAVPLGDAEGPDITFLEIPKGDSLSALAAIKSFWNIDFEPEERLAKCSNDLGIFVTIGQPNELENVYWQDARTVHLNLMLRGYIGPVRCDHVFGHEGYDFVDTVVKYDGQDMMPSTFGGISGGGLWKVELENSEQEESWKAARPLLCGLAFYQTELIGAERRLRCHFSKSIYLVSRTALSNGD